MPPKLTASAGADDDYNSGWPRAVGVANLASIRTTRLALPMRSSRNPDELPARSRGRRSAPAELMGAKVIPAMATV